MKCIEAAKKSIIITFGLKYLGAACDACHYPIKRSFSVDEPANGTGKF